MHRATARRMKQQWMLKRSSKGALPSAASRLSRFGHRSSRGISMLPVTASMSAMPIAPLVPVQRPRKGSARLAKTRPWNVCMSWRWLSGRSSATKVRDRKRSAAWHLERKTSSRL
eukprot:scaffold142221_cov105-Phaeocystis_antarctica.AAC.1